MDIPGISERERELAAHVARFHRRSPPTKDHPSLASLNLVERRVVRGLTTLLRIADGADHGRRQPVNDIDVRSTASSTTVRLVVRRGAVIDDWDHEAERALFRSCFGRSLAIDIAPATNRRSRR
jgi:exopolyphosphatase/guanosine-5'-triphosphate,3'-diphosphate pyrophosphatase